MQTRTILNKITKGFEDAEPERVGQAVRQKTKINAPAQYNWLRFPVRFLTVTAQQKTTQYQVLLDYPARHHKVCGPVTKQLQYVEEIFYIKQNNKL